MPPSDPNARSVDTRQGPVRAVEMDGPAGHRRTEYYRPAAPTWPAFAWGVVVGLVLAWVLISLRSMA